MHKFLRLLIPVLVSLNFLFSHSSSATNPAYEQRKADYISNALASPNSDAITIQAFATGTVDTVYLDNLLSGIVSGTTSDFDIVKLIRVLYFTNGTYDSDILPVLNAVPYWLTKDETQRTYWSENHMIMWMSSDWLLHERYGRAIDSTLDYRLRHFLRMKVDYGFYEFFSSVYGPYCLTGLLNLADFAEDAEIKDLATQASQRMLREFLMLANDKGTYFPAAGRNYFGKYATPYGQNHNQLIYLLSGFGEVPGYVSHAGGFLASSTLPVDDVIDSWLPELNTMYSIGHSLDTSFVLNSGLSHVDRIMAQWSGGAYFPPSVALESGMLIEDSNLWNHVDFTAFQPYSTLDVQTFPIIAENASAISKSSVIMGEKVAIFKHNSVTLSSAQDFWKGKVGYQQIPLAANVGTTAVFTISGEVLEWDDRTDANENTHLPYIEQVNNVALLMYRPEPTLAFFGYPETPVTLHWIEDDFDEVRESGNWLLGRQDESYVGVRRSCTGMINNMWACDAEEGQAWVVMVGDSGMYNSFDDFQAVLDSSHFTEEWYLDTVNSQWVYYASIDVDTVSIDYAWNRDSVLNSGIFTPGADNTLALYPNPAADKVTLDLSAFGNTTVNIRILNAMGQEVYFSRQAISSSSLVSIPLESWSAGIYFCTAGDGVKRASQKLIKQVR